MWFSASISDKFLHAYMVFVIMYWFWSFKIRAENIYGMVLDNTVHMVNIIPWWIVHFTSTIQGNSQIIDSIPLKGGLGNIP